MAIHSRKNQYFGINAHANSLLQDPDFGWQSFHHDHITDLTRAINDVLPSGYIAISERSLQIQEWHAADSTGQVRYPQPDVTVFERERSRTQFSVFVPFHSIGTITPVIETMDISDDELGATVIYKIQESARRGKPITRIELLSPANKPPQSGYPQYRDKRNTTLRSGMPLIEIDYLHQQPSVNKSLASYPQAADSHPYNVIVNYPQPSIYDGFSQTITFDVDEVIPKFDIPLDEGHRVTDFDLNKVYNFTFGQALDLITDTDYEVLPMRIETYSEVDQARIRRRMQTIIAMRDAGHNLDEEGPFPLAAM